MRTIDRLSSALAVVAGVLTLLLIGVMIFEVISRYVFSKPTLWAGDMTYMLGGALFLLSAPFTLKEGGHVAIDFLMQLLPARVREGALGLLLAFGAFPAFASIAWVAANRAISAFQSGETDPVSAFAPQLWPFYTAVALSLVVLSMQILVNALRAFGKAGGLHG